MSKCNARIEITVVFLPPQVLLNDALDSIEEHRGVAMGALEDLGRRARRELPDPDFIEQVWGGRNRTESRRPGNGCCYGGEWVFRLDFKQLL